MLATKDIWDKAPEAPHPELARRISDRILIEMKCSYLFLRRLWAKVTRDFTLQEGRKIGARLRQGAFKNGAGTASSPRLVSSTAFYGDEPSPPLLAHFLERSLCSLRSLQRSGMQNLIRSLSWN